MGGNALARFDRGVLSHRHADTVILMIGINDIGWPGCILGATTSKRRGLSAFFSDSAIAFANPKCKLSATKLLDCGGVVDHHCLILGDTWSVPSRGSRKICNMQRSIAPRCVWRRRQV